MMNKTRIREKDLFIIFQDNNILTRLEGENARLPHRRIFEEGNISLSHPVLVEKKHKRRFFTAAIENLQEEKNQFLESRGFSFYSRRSLFGIIKEDFFALSCKAFEIVTWRRNHQFCGYCGTATVRIEKEYAMMCPNCKLVAFPRISPAVIVAAIRDGKILLAHNRRFPGDIHSLIAGFVDPGENLEDTVHREVKEEAGIEVTNIRYFGSQQWAFPHSLMIGFFSDYAAGEIIVDGDEIDHADWFSPDSLPPLPPKESIARKIIDRYCDAAIRG